jgi:hypothetical protein
MAEIAYSVDTTTGGDKLLTWAGVTEADTFQQYLLTEVVSEISTHISGTFGGSTVTIKGGNVISEMLGMTQIGGDTAVATTADIFSILDRPLYIQPTHAGGSSTTLNVYMLVRN